MKTNLAFNCISGPKPRRSLPRRTSKGLTEDFQMSFRRPPADLYVSQKTFRKDLYIFQRSFRRPREELYVVFVSILGDLRPECHIPAKLWPTFRKTHFSLAHGPEKPTPLLL
jgi:hypothetical protein